MTTGTKATSGRRRGNLRGEQLYLAALKDERLIGQQDAIYFVLRGVGVPVTKEPGQLVPQMTINSAEFPALFMRLRQMEMKAVGKIIILSPKPLAVQEPSISDLPMSQDAEPVDVVQAMETATAPAPLASRPGAPAVLYTSPFFSASMQPSGRRAQYRPTSPEQQVALFDRLALPKHAVSKNSVTAALTKALIADPEAEAREAALRPQRRRAIEEDLQLTVSEGIGFAASTSASVARRVLVERDDEEIEPVWSPKPAKVMASQQQMHHHLLAQPRKKVETYSKSLPCLQRQPTAKCMASQRDLQARVAMLKAHQVAQEEKRIQAEIESHYARDAEIAAKTITKLEAQRKEVIAAWKWRSPGDTKGPFVDAFEHRLRASWQSQPDLTSQGLACHSAPGSPLRCIGQGTSGAPGSPFRGTASGSAFVGAGPQHGLVGWQLARGKSQSPVAGGAAGSTSPLVPHVSAEGFRKSATGAFWGDATRSLSINSAPGRVEAATTALPSISAE